MVVEEGLHLLRRGDDARARVAVLFEHELERLPVGEHLVERLLERVLLGRLPGDLVELLEVLLEPHLLELSVVVSVGQKE